MEVSKFVCITFLVTKSFDVSFTDLEILMLFQHIFLFEITVLFYNISCVEHNTHYKYIFMRFLFPLFVLF